MSEKNPKGNVYCFRPVCTIAQAEKTVKDLSTALAKHREILCDLSEITEIDLSFIQILYSAKKEAVKQNKELHLTGTVPEVVKKAFLIGGFCSDATDAAEIFEKMIYDFC